MNNVLLICEKELKSYFASPIAYLLMAFFGLIFGFGFYTATRDYMRFREPADRRAMPDDHRLVVNCEALRLTSRLTHIMAWLLIRTPAHPEEKVPCPPFVPAPKALRRRFASRPRCPGDRPARSR